MPDEPRRIEQGLLTIHSEPQDDARFVSLHGALDLANTKALEDEFIRIEATSVSRIMRRPGASYPSSFVSRIRSAHTSDPSRSTADRIAAGIGTGRRVPRST